MAYIVYCSYEGDNKYFYHLNKAQEWKQMKSKELHEKYCVDKEVPDIKHCFCNTSTSEKKVICSAHAYARDVIKHDWKNCNGPGMEVYIEEIEIN